MRYAVTTMLAVAIALSMVADAVAAPIRVASPNGRVKAALLQ